MAESRYHTVGTGPTQVFADSHRAGSARVVGKAWQGCERAALSDSAQPQGRGAHLGLRSLELRVQPLLPADQGRLARAAGVLLWLLLGVPLSSGACTCTHVALLRSRERPGMRLRPTTQRAAWPQRSSVCQQQVLSCLMLITKLLGIKQQTFIPLLEQSLIVDSCQ